jgi:hypothetical protein
MCPLYLADCKCRYCVCGPSQLWACVVVQAPGLPFRVPQVYASGPLLTGRAQVRFVVEKQNGGPAFVDSAEGGMLKQGTFVLTLDGYSSPVSAGAFAWLVSQGKYDGCVWSSGYASVVAGGGVAPAAKVPLEILPIGAALHSNLHAIVPG